MNEWIDVLRVRLASHAPRSVELPPQFVRASVLVPLLLHAGGPTLLLIERHGDLRAHAGQIAFPGGKLDAGEALAACALREAEEEVALPSSAVELIGRLDEVPTPTGFVMTPFVGLVASPPALVPNALEVSSILEVPLAALTAPEAYEHQGTREWMGFRYEMHAYRHGGQVIWGATARVLWQLLALLEI